MFKLLSTYIYNIKYMPKCEVKDFNPTLSKGDDNILSMLDNCAVYEITKPDALLSFLDEDLIQSVDFLGGIRKKLKRIVLSSVNIFSKLNT